MTDEEYDQFVKDSAGYLCGFSCGTAVDVIIEYTTRPDISMHQFNRLVKELNIYHELWKKDKNEKNILPD